MKEKSLKKSQFIHHQNFWKLGTIDEYEESLKLSDKELYKKFASKEKKEMLKQIKIDNKNRLKDERREEMDLIITFGSKITKWEILYDPLKKLFFFYNRSKYISIILHIFEYFQFFSFMIILFFKSILL